MFIKLLILVFLPFLNYSSRGSPWQNTAKQENTKKDTKNTDSQEILGKEIWTLEFWESLRIIPVKFVGKNGDILSAQFSSKNAVQQINFTFLLEKAHSFSKQDGEWEQEIDSKEFLKKMKDDFWLITYFPDQKNLIYAAHQFKNWENVGATFGGDPDQILKFPENFAYWTKLRMKMVYFYRIQGDDNIYWIFISATNNPRDPADDEILEFHDFRIKRRFTSAVGQDFIILENGMFTLDKNCVFNTIEVKVPKLKIIPSIPFVRNANIRTRGKPISKEDFLENLGKNLWYCFYDESTGNLLRVIERVQDDIKEK